MKSLQEGLLEKGIVLRLIPEYAHESIKADDSNRHEGKKGKGGRLPLPFFSHQCERNGKEVGNDGNDEHILGEEIGNHRKQ